MLNLDCVVATTLSVCVWRVTVLESVRQRWCCWEMWNTSANVLCDRGRLGEEMDCCPCRLSVLSLLAPSVRTCSNGMRI